MVLATILVAVLGLTIGSFLGVVTYRLPKGRNFVSGRSLCPKCGAVISWFDNIPIFSFLALGGRCRHCRKPISPRYPLIETATAVGFAGLYLLLGACRSSGEIICTWKEAYGGFGMIILFILLAITIAVFVIDLEGRIIPDELIFTGFVLTLTPLLLGTAEGLFLHLFAAFSASLFLLCLHLVTKGRGMGLGDVKYALFAGLFLGWPLSVVWLFAAFLTGALVAIILILAGKAKRKDKIAFGPFLAFSFIVTSVWGIALSQWLLP